MPSIKGDVLLLLRRVCGAPGGVIKGVAPLARRGEARAQIRRLIEVVLASSTRKRIDVAIVSTQNCARPPCGKDTTLRTAVAAAHGFMVSLRFLTLHWTPSCVHGMILAWLACSLSSSRMGRPTTGT